jgi:ABC-type multidrug transport system fused ATPase/permease subunit
MFFHAVLRMEIGWFDLDANTSGALSSRLSSDAPAVRGAVADTLAVILQNVVTLCVGYVTAFVNGWKMTLVVTAVLPLLGFSSYMQMKFFTGAMPVRSRRCSARVPLSTLLRRCSACAHLQQAWPPQQQAGLSYSSTRYAGFSRAHSAAACRAQQRRGPAV